MGQIGQALRVALSLGMNREPPQGTLTRTEYDRRRRLWWTLYIIDRKLSINMGAPLSISDKDCDILLPRQEDLGVSNSALLIHIKLAFLEGEVMSGKLVTAHTMMLVIDSSKLLSESTADWIDLS